MPRFARPDNTITDASDLRVGDHIWHVYGIWPPQMGGEHIVTGVAVPFSKHREYSDIHVWQSNETVFDERWIKSKRSHMSFAGDCNMDPRKSHNDNYCFRSEEAAVAAVDFLTLQWQLSGAIEAEIARREEDKHFDCID